VQCIVKCFPVDDNRSPASAASVGVGADDRIAEGPSRRYPRRMGGRGTVPALPSSSFLFHDKSPAQSPSSHRHNY
jgi:hypothetical protein